MWQIFPLLEAFRSDLALCSCWFSQYFLKCSRILRGVFFKDGKMWWHENLFHLMKSQQPSLLNKTLVWHRSSWKPSSYSLEPDWFLDVWNRHILGLLLGYCFSSVAKVGVLFRSLWDFVASVRWCQESCAHLAADGAGEAPREWYPELHWVRSSAAQTRSPELSTEHKCLSTEHSFLAQTATLAQACS